MSEILSLLSEHALIYLLNKRSSFVEVDKCAALIKEVIKSRKESHSNNLSTIIRYCNQNSFNVIFCGGINCNTRNVASDVYSFKATEIKNVSNLPQMKEARH